jgi:tRNA-dihydrouridine synthase
MTSTKPNLKLHSIITNDPDFKATLEYNEQLQLVNNLLLQIGEFESGSKSKIELKSKLQTIIQDLKIPKNILQKQSSKTPKTVIIGNGDVENYEDGISKVESSGVNGIMIGRGIFRQPWAFLDQGQREKLDNKKNRLNLLIEHLELWTATWDNIKDRKHDEDFVPNSPDNINLKNFASMKKFVKMYVSGFDGALELRTKLMELRTPNEIITEVKANL